MSIQQKIQEVRDTFQSDYGLNVDVSVIAYPFIKGNEFIGDKQAAYQLALAMAQVTSGEVREPGAPYDWFNVKTDGVDIAVHYFVKGVDG